MLITLMCDNISSWIITYIEELENEIKELGHQVKVINNYKKLHSVIYYFYYPVKKFYQLHI